MNLLQRIAAVVLIPSGFLALHGAAPAWWILTPAAAFLAATAATHIQLKCWLAKPHPGEAPADLRLSFFCYLTSGTNLVVADIVTLSIYIQQNRLNIDPQSFALL